ncbi:MAG: hypothetical protein K2I75_06015 [Clostridiales bacterium]|nr:hypothetical protein [Clostridiales bacterium]
MVALYKLIPDKYSAVIDKRLSLSRLSELRIINGAPVRVCYDGAYYFLCESGLTKDKSVAFTADGGSAEQIVMRACSHSLFTVTDTLKRGYVSVAGGIRVGVCGAGVMQGGTLTAVKDFYSVNIRLPHEVKGCAGVLAQKLTFNGRIKNTLILSPPAAGKTTILRDLCRLLSDGGRSVLLCDEKYEIASVSGGRSSLDVGCCTDVISGVDKPKVFEMGIANMSPEIIMTDELFAADLPYVRRASTCGIAVIATAHARNIDELKAKQEYSDIVSHGVFDSYVVLSGPPLRTVTVYEGVVQ